MPLVYLTKKAGQDSLKLVPTYLLIPRRLKHGRKARKKGSFFGKGSDPSPVDRSYRHFGLHVRVGPRKQESGQSLANVALVQNKDHIRGPLYF